MSIVGYEHLRLAHALPIFEITTPARVGSVNAVQRLAGGSLLVPRSVAPDPAASVLNHILFALKHEGINLQALAAALPLVPEQELLAELVRTPNGQYVRKACMLWELFTGRDLPLPAGPAPTAPYTPLFDPVQYLTGAVRRHPKWRVDFNGLGSPKYCLTVRRTPQIEALLAKNLMEQAATFARSIGNAMLERALAWAYLSETEGSFAIEGESPSPDKASAFAALLKQAHLRRPLTEGYLVELQNAAITNPLDLAASFRTQQNWLRGASRGSLGITYVPPPPDLTRELMKELMSWVNEQASAAASPVDPLVSAALASFGFVLLHPFMDGNGRLSRFLVHQVLCQSGRMPDGFLLPVSVAMKRHEDEYLKALTSFSRPARRLCGVTWLQEDDYEFTWPPGYEGVFRYFDATPCVEFCLRMAETALTHDLRHETVFLADYDAVVKSINDTFDLRGSDLAALTLRCFEREGAISLKRRKQYADRVPALAFDAIETAVKARLAARSPPDGDDTLDEAPEQ